MECFGIQTFPFSRMCLKGLTSQDDKCLTSSGDGFDVHWEDGRQDGSQDLWTGKHFEIVPFSVPASGFRGTTRVLPGPPAETG
jgi:hypothetical protein